MDRHTMTFEERMAEVDPMDHADIDCEELTQEEQEWRDNERLYVRDMQNAQLFDRLRTMDPFEEEGR